MIKEKLYQRFAFNNFISGKYEKAEYWFQKIANIPPRRMGTGHNLGLVKLALLKYIEAIELFTLEIENYGETFPRVRALADAYYLSDNRELAAKWYEKAEKIGVTEADGRLAKERIGICGSEEQYSNALKAMELFNAGTKAEINGDIPKAVGFYSEAINLDPTHYMARNNLGSILMNKTKDFAQAAFQFSSALIYTTLPLIEKNLTVCKAEQEKSSNGK